MVQLLLIAGDRHSQQTGDDVCRNHAIGSEIWSWSMIADGYLLLLRLQHPAPMLPLPSDQGIGVVSRSCDGVGSGRTRSQNTVDYL